MLLLHIAKTHSVRYSHNVLLCTVIQLLNNSD
nr:MAG TPA: hypothetical protein [Caudoviricetes sp.]